MKKQVSPFNLWISGFVNFAHQSKQSENPSFNFMSEAILLGLDYTRINTVGGCFGYAHSQLHDSNHFRKANIPYYFGTLWFHMGNGSGWKVRDRGAIMACFNWNRAVF